MAKRDQVIDEPMIRTPQADTAAATDTDTEPQTESAPGAAPGSAPVVMTEEEVNRFLQAHPDYLSRLRLESGPAASDVRLQVPFRHQDLQFKVMHGAVGRFLQGAVVTAAELQGRKTKDNPNPPRVDLERLVNLGALQPIMPDTMDAVRADLAMTSQVYQDGSRTVPSGW